MGRVKTLALRTAPGVLLAVAVWLSLFAYAGRPLLVAAASLSVPPVLAWLALFALAGIGVLPAIYRRDFSLRGRSVMHWAGYMTVALFSILLTLVVMGDFVRLVYRTVDVRLLSFAILGGAGVLSLVRFFQARCPRVKRVTVPVDNLPPELDGYRIAQWSDVHIGPTIQRGFVASLVERTNALNADAVVITGDLVDGYLADLREHIAPLGTLHARDGVYFVTGNHEYYWRASEWVGEIARLGITFLKNEHRVVERNGARIVFAGVTDPAGRYTHRQDVKAALLDAPEDAVKVLLSHRPQTATAASNLGADLQFSGHTHGGQFFPFNLVIRWFQPIVAGLHRVGNTWLYVSRGTGYWGPPSRLGVGGELTVVELRRA